MEHRVAYGALYWAGEHRGWSELHAEYDLCLANIECESSVKLQVVPKGLFYACVWVFEVKFGQEILSWELLGICGN